MDLSLSLSRWDSWFVLEGVSGAAGGWEVPQGVHPPSIQ